MPAGGRDAVFADFTGKFVKKGGKAALVKADGEVRRSQAIRTYGPGSLMDLVNRAALVGGLAPGEELAPGLRLRDASSERGPRLTFQSGDAEIHVEIQASGVGVGAARGPSDKAGAQGDDGGSAERAPEGHSHDGGIGHCFYRAVKCA